MVHNQKKLCRVSMCISWQQWWWMMKSMLRYYSLCCAHTAGSLVMFENHSSYPLISFASTFVLPLMNDWKNETHWYCLYWLHWWKEKELVEKTELEHNNYCAFKEMTQEPTKVLEELSSGICSLPLMRVLKFCFFVTGFHSFSWMKVEDLGTSHHKKWKFCQNLKPKRS
jgi:hypothetical protein